VAGAAEAADADTKLFVDDQRRSTCSPGRPRRSTAPAGVFHAGLRRRQSVSTRRRRLPLPTLFHCSPRHLAVSLHVIRHYNYGPAISQSVCCARRKVGEVTSARDVITASNVTAVDDVTYASDVNSSSDFTTVGVTNETERDPESGESSPNTEDSVQSSAWIVKRWPFKLPATGIVGHRPPRYFLIREHFLLVPLFY